MMPPQNYAKMRMQLLKIVVILLVAGSGDTRPQNGADSQAKTIERNDAGWRSIQVSSKSHDIVRDDSSGQVNDTHRDLKDLQYMDQSLRTVATQLLNVTNPQDVVNVNNKDLIKAEHNVATTPKSSENSVPLLMRDVSSEINLEPVHFGRPINSKFSYFESSHPGQAMAMTEEELEREMSTTRLITAYKNHPTTTGGISTWILLNPPSTTVKSVEIEKSKTQQPFQTEVRLTVRPSSSIEKETIPQVEKITEKTTPQLTPVITTEKVTIITKKPSMTTTKKIVTTSKPEKVTQNSEKNLETSSSTTLKVIRTTTTSTSTTSDGTATLTVLTTKKSQPPRTTSKPKITTPRTTLHSKPAITKPASMKPTTTKPVRPKPTRKPTVKPETVKNETSTSTGKIEKVTFKPISIITTPQDKLENTEKPMFVTKIKASVLMDTQKTPTTLLPATTATTVSASTTFKSNLSTVDLVEVPVRSKPVNTKGNNVLKVQLKKPIDETTQIEIEPIKVNAPILTIEKVDNTMDEIMMKDTDDLNDSRIDLKFDFNPELTKINVETKAEADATTSTSATASTTTKRPRHNSKRKKNKTRRRKPTTTSAPTSTMVPVLMEINESVTDSTITDNAVQESKIAPETKVGANTTKTKKKQPQKAISTQIYNFLSREVMPSFGVMSLVGLGLGLASYFLYPFGGTITRRNYDVEPNYKYNMDEYGGNYGQSEEEMLSKVFQGMTNYENKYPGTKDNYNNNYYHYQHYDGAYDTQTKKVETRYPSVSTSPVYKAVENTQPAVKYRNTDFQYPEAQTTPAFYYDRKRPDFAEVVTSSAANRQFVVGNVPKEYPFDVKAANLPVDNKKGYMSTEVGQTQFEREVSQNFDFPNAAGLHSYGHLGASTIRADDGYEEIEITPTAVAVEHGPRSLKVKRSALNEGGRGRRSRSKRESVIQIIPTKRELEEEREEAEKEEDLSNEILDIIDSALPGGEVPHKTRGSNENEVEDLEGQKRKQQEEANTRVKESTSKTTHTEDTTEIPTTSTTVGKIDDGGTSVSSEKSTDTTHPADSKDPETIEWFDSSTTKKPSEGFSLINFVKKVAEIKFRLGLTILKHASEGFARYLGHVQKRINGEE